MAQVLCCSTGAKQTAVTNMVNRMPAGAWPKGSVASSTTTVLQIASGMRSQWHELLRVDAT